MRFIGPLLVFLLLVGLFYKSLDLRPKDTVSTMLVNTPAPAFSIGSVAEPARLVSEALWQGKVSVLNVWASWCPVCEAEHKLWVDLAKTQDFSLWQLIGLNYHDRLENARHFLAQEGDPYKLHLFDEQGTLGIEYGIAVTPETFVIDKRGMIRYRHPGGITKGEWEKDIWPLIQKLSKE